MTEMSTYAPTELAHRSSRGLDVTLIWVRDGDQDRAVVRVRDGQDGAYLEIAMEPYLALDVCHAFAHWDFSTVDYGDSRLAA